MKSLFLTLCICTLSLFVKGQSNSISYCIDNFQTVNLSGTQQASQFDVVIQAAQANSMLGDGVVYIDYDPQ